MKRECILVIGASGQIGTELTDALRRTFGDSQVIAADLRPLPDLLQSKGPFEKIDALNKDALARVVDRYDVTQIYLLAAMLSATGENNPQLTWNLNMESLLNVLQLA